MRIIALSLIALPACVLVWVRPAHAEDAPPTGSLDAHAPVANDQNGWLTHPAVRVSLALTGGLATMQRSTSDPTNDVGGFTFGGELRVHPYSAHGFVLAFSNSAGVFGPNVNVVDAAYSLRVLGAQRLTGVHPAVYLDLGPSVGFVSGASPTPDHTVLGGRASVALDLQLANFTLGLEGAYRGGVPLGVQNDPWEGEFSAVVRCGVALDFAAKRSQRHATTATNPFTW
jgi:hypothetical protein